MGLEGIMAALLARCPTSQFPGLIKESTGAPLSPRLSEQELLLLLTLLTVFMELRLSLLMDQPTTLLLSTTLPQLTTPLLSTLPPLSMLPLLTMPLLSMPPQPITPPPTPMCHLHTPTPTL